MNRSVWWAWTWFDVAASWMHFMNRLSLINGKMDHYPGALVSNTHNQRHLNSNLARHIHLMVWSVFIVVVVVVIACISYTNWTHSNHFKSKQMEPVNGKKKKYLSDLTMVKLRNSINNSKLRYKCFPSIIRNTAHKCFNLTWQTGDKITKVHLDTRLKVRSFAFALICFFSTHSHSTFVYNFNLMIDWNA